MLKPISRNDLRRCNKSKTILMRVSLKMTYLPRIKEMTMRKKAKLRKRRRKRRLKQSRKLKKRMMS